MDRVLPLEFVRVTEAAAINCARWIGRGNKNAADQAAVDAMRGMLDSVNVDGTVVIGEGERDEAPMLYIGEKVGSGEYKVDIALDPLEGTQLTADGHNNALSVIAVAEAGAFLHAPDTYMKKIACGPEAKGLIDINKSLTENLGVIAEAKKKSIHNCTVMILDRERHMDMVEEARSLGARVRLFTDGDVAAALFTCFEESDVDLFMGIGGAPEGVLGAAGLRCLGGDFQGQLVFRKEEEIARAKKMIKGDINRVFKINELAGGDDVIFCASGVTRGDMLKGVHIAGGKVYTESLVMRAYTGTIRRVSAVHHVDNPKFRHFGKI